MEKYLVVIPIFTFALFTSMTIVQYTMTNFESVCSTCPSTLPTCSQSTNPVLGGLDVIPYFYNHSYVGERGIDILFSVYNGFTYLFSTNDHKAMFDENPEQYIPQYGGYCAWGIAGEYCPAYPWSETCLGPSGNWQYGTVISQKLYFFLYADAKDKFMANVAENMEAGDERWLSWFSSIDEPVNTDCFS
jgi:hypothetical protein